MMTFFRYLIALAAVSILTVPPAAAAEKEIRITAIVDHPALDSCRKGAIEALAEQGFADGKGARIEFQSAQGDVGTAGQIARKFAGDKPDIIIAIATPSAQAMVAAVRGNTPIVFSAVSDPLAARLVPDLNHPGGNVTGVTDRLPLERHLALIQEIVPGVKRIGALFNPGEANSVAEIARFTALAKEKGITIVEGAAPDTNSVQSSARSLAGKVDAFFVPLDNTVVSAMEAVVKVGIDAKIPLFVADTDSVRRGAVATVGFYYHSLGRQTGLIAAKILNGAKPGDIPVREVETLQLVINPASAARMGVRLPEAVTARADEIVK